MNFSRTILAIAGLASLLTSGCGHIGPGLSERPEAQASEPPSSSDSYEQSTPSYKPVYDNQGRLCAQSGNTAKGCR